MSSVVFHHPGGPLLNNCGSLHNVESELTVMRDVDLSL